MKKRGRPPTPQTKKLGKYFKLSQDILKFLATLKNQNAFVEEAIRQAITKTPSP